MTRQDWEQVIRDLPVAALIVVGLWAFCVLLFAIVP